MNFYAKNDDAVPSFVVLKVAKFEMPCRVRWRSRSRSRSKERVRDFVMLKSHLVFKKRFRSGLPMMLLAEGFAGRSF